MAAPGAPAVWEIQLSGTWKPLEARDAVVCEKTFKAGTGTVASAVRSGYTFDVRKMAQINDKTSFERQIRRTAPAEAPEELGAMPPPSVSLKVPTASFAMKRTVSKLLAPSAAPPPSGAVQASGFNVSGFAEDGRRVELWLAGRWKPLPKEQSEYILRKLDSKSLRFDHEDKTNKQNYSIDLEQMTQTNKGSGRSRTIRVAQEGAEDFGGFDDFAKRFTSCLKEAGCVKEQLGLLEFQKNWPADSEQQQRLLMVAAPQLHKEMDVRGTSTVDLMEWNHFWAMERDSPSYHAITEVNKKMKQALLGGKGVEGDPQVLGRMQMHFDTAMRETAATDGLPTEGLKKVCERLVASPKETMEKRWAQEVLDVQASGEGMDEDETLSYFDFLNVMMGRKRFKVYLWMYDISNGKAKNWSWLLLGQSFEGIWHTGVVIEWPKGNKEFWFGGRLFISEPGTTPFGLPVEKRFLGYTYKLHQEVLDYLGRHCATEFTQANYDVLTHNCNHFSNKLCLYLRNEHIPDQVLKQPDMVMNTVTARALRPLLNRWLGGFGEKEGESSDGADQMAAVWAEVWEGAVVEFSTKEGGRPIIGEVMERFSEESIIVHHLDFWKGDVQEFEVPRELFTKVLQKSKLPRRTIPQSPADTGGVLGWWCSPTPTVQ